MQKPTIDILLATYNGEKFLNVQLDSILNQTYPHLHIYVSDDGSKDRTLEILEKYRQRHPHKITVLPFNGNLGINRNFSYLLEKGSHDYFMFSDQDDFWMPEKVAKTLAKMQQSESVLSAETPILVHTDLKVADHELNIIASSFWEYGKLFPKTGSSLNRLLVQNNVTGCTVMVNAALRKLALPIPKEAMMHDWWLALVAAAFGKVEFINEPTMLYRQHLNNANGATKFNISTVLKGFCYTDPKKALPIQERNKIQTKVFLERFSKSMPSRQKKIVESYVSFLEKSYFGKIPLALRYGFLKNGFLRNVVYMLPKFHSILLGKLRN